MNAAETKKNADAARKLGISLFAIGVGSGVGTDELKSIANDPDKDFLFTVGNFDALKNIIFSLADKACKSK